MQSPEHKVQYVNSYVKKDKKKMTTVKQRELVKE